MKNGPARFEHYLGILEEQLKTAITSDNPSLWLLTNDARTTFFMLEGLARVYAQLHNKKRFNKLRDEFKTLEDGLGRIDYYREFAKELGSDPAIPPGIPAFLEKRAAVQAAAVNKLLEKEKWIGEKANKLGKIRKKLESAEWLSAKEEVMGVRKYYAEYIREINAKFKEFTPGFTEIESQVHAIRRKLRWLSIYPRALQGMVQLTSVPVKDPLVLEYLTPDVMASAFNKMPEAGDNTFFLLLEKDQFFALSWMISELGKLKDSGLKIFATAEALENLESLNYNAALQKSGQLVAGDEAVLLKILNQATTITKRYFKGKHLEKLVYGVGKFSR
jgi:hypothetical protein